MTRTGAADRIRECACGAWYGDDPEGHAAHRAVHGHPPRDPAPPEPRPHADETREEGPDVVQG